MVPPSTFFIETRTLNVSSGGPKIQVKEPFMVLTCPFLKQRPLFLILELNSDVLSVNKLHVCSHPWVYFEEGTRKRSPQLHQMEQQQHTGRRTPPSMLQRK